MDIFYIKLIGRRIAIGLHLKGRDLGDISDVLKYQQLRKGDIDKLMFSTYLALSTKLSQEIPNLLVEERNWIEQELGINIHNTTDRNAHRILKEYLSKLHDNLRKAGCPDDFVDEKLLIASNESAQHHLRTAMKLATKYHIYDFRAGLEKLSCRMVGKDEALFDLLLNGLS